MKLFRNRKQLTAGLTLLVILLVGVWAFGYYRRHQQLARAHELRQQLTGEAGRKLPPDQRRELWKKYGQEVKQLSPEQRRDLTKDRREAVLAKLQKFFQMSKKERTVALDADIDRMEKWRKQRDSGAGGGPGGPGAKGGGPPRDAQDRERMRRQRLDETTPEERALRAEYFKLLNQRRQQRGLTPTGRG
jgi:uncharacterized membrane protein